MMHLQITQIFLFFSFLILFQNTHTTYLSNSNSKKKSFAKMLERCEDLLTCESCLNYADYCGWCYTDGLCKSGNEIGPTGSNVCKYADWDTAKCKSRNCETYTNLLACVTQKSCFWCGDAYKGDCLDNSQRTDIECDNVVIVDDYMKAPKLFREGVYNNNVNKELENIFKPKKGKKSGNNLFASDLDSDKRKFVNKLDIWVKTNNAKNINKGFSKYNSISNPTGVFSYQLNNNNNKKNATDFYFNSEINLNISAVNLNSLSEPAQKELHEISKQAAKDLLIAMFTFKNGRPDMTVVKAEMFKGNKYYLLLESIADDYWKDYLYQLGLYTADIHKTLQIDDKNSSVNGGDKSHQTKILQTQNKLSIMYPFKLSAEDISYLNFKRGEWSKVPGSNITMNTYINSTVFITQRVKFFGSGKNFESVFLHNDDDLKALSNLASNKHFNRIDLNFFIARQLEPGVHNFYTAYKSDFKVNKQNENNLIMTYTLEFPYILPNGVINTQSEFEFKKYVNGTNSWFKINELTTHFRNQPFEYDYLNVKRFNYIIFFHIYQKFKKNVFLKLKVWETKTEYDYKEVIGSHTINIPSMGMIKNVGGMALISLPEGYFEVNVRGKFIFDDLKHERLDDDVYKQDLYANNTKTLGRVSAEDSYVTEEIDFSFLEMPLHKKLNKIRSRKESEDSDNQDKEVFASLNLTNLNSDLQLAPSVNPLKDSGSVSALLLPASSKIYTTSFKNVFYYKGNRELNEINNMKQAFKITTDRHILIQITIIITLPKPCDLDFRLYINGKDNADSFMSSKREQVVNLSTVTVEKYPPGEYNMELLYLASENGMASMSDNDWDVISMNIVVLEVQ